jgi:hypothetical protein
MLTPVRRGTTVGGSVTFVFGPSDTAREESHGSEQTRRSLSDLQAHRETQLRPALAGRERLRGACTFLDDTLAPSHLPGFDVREANLMIQLQKLFQLNELIILAPAVCDVLFKFLS